MKKRCCQCRKKSGFSLVELTVAIALALGLASTVVVLAAQHTFFMKHLGSFAFLRDEAPQINRVLTSLLASSNSYWIYDNKEAAFADEIPTNVGSALVLSYRSPTGDLDEVAISFDAEVEDKALNIYSKNNGWQAEPNWTITSIVEDVEFSDETGVLTIALTGRRGEEITYMGGVR